MTDVKAGFLMVGGIGFILTAIILVGVPVWAIGATIGLIALVFVGLIMIVIAKGHFSEEDEKDE